MYYENICKGRFLARPNRFIAHVALEEGATSHSGEGFAVCHVKNTGRCKELLVPGATVYLQECNSPSRKTKYDLIAVEKAPSPHPAPRATSPQGKASVKLINMDAQAPNKVFGEWLAAGGMGFVPALIKPETTYGKSRFDFYFEAPGGPSVPPTPTKDRPPLQPPVGGGITDAPPLLRRGFVEVKGVTLEEDGAVYFPDAPTQRGVKHIEELIACKAEGYEACLCFVIQMAGVKSFSPNDATHPAFGDALRRAAAAGVAILAYDCAVTPDSLTMGQPVPIKL